MDIIKEKKAIRAEAEKAVGHRIVQKFWDLIEEAVGNAAEDFDGDPEGQEEYIESYRTVAGSYTEALKVGESLTKVKPSKSDNDKPSEPTKRRHEFEQRFYLVSFVIDCWERDGRQYIPWPYVTTEWNKAPLSDQIGKKVLKAEYYRALRERGIVIQLLALKKWNNYATFLLFLERLRKHYNVDPGTLKTFNEAWLYLVMKKDDEPLRKFLKQIKWQSTTDISALKAKLNIKEAQNE